MSTPSSTKATHGSNETNQAAEAAARLAADEAETRENNAQPFQTGSDWVICRLCKTTESNDNFITVRAIDVSKPLPGMQSLEFKFLPKLATEDHIMSRLWNQVHDAPGDIGTLQVDVECTLTFRRRVGSPEGTKWLMEFARGDKTKAG